MRFICRWRWRWRRMEHLPSHISAVQTDVRIVRVSVCVCVHLISFDIIPAVDAAAVAVPVVVDVGIKFSMRADGTHSALLCTYIVYWVRKIDAPVIANDIYIYLFLHSISSLKDILAFASRRYSLFGASNSSKYFHKFCFLFWYWCPLWVILSELELIKINAQSIGNAVSVQENSKFLEIYANRFAEHSANFCFIFRIIVLVQQILNKNIEPKTHS